MLINDMDCVTAYVNWDITKADAVLAWGRIKKFIEESVKQPTSSTNNKRDAISLRNQWKAAHENDKFYVIDKLITDTIIFLGKLS